MKHKKLSIAKKSTCYFPRSNINRNRKRDLWFLSLKWVVVRDFIHNPNLLDRTRQQGEAMRVSVSPESRLVQLCCRNWTASVGSRELALRATTPCFYVNAVIFCLPLIYILPNQCPVSRKNTRDPNLLDTTWPILHDAWLYLGEASCVSVSPESRLVQLYCRLGVHFKENL